MTWQCRLIDIVGTRKIELDPEKNGGICGRTVLVDAAGTEHDWHDLPVGTMFYLPKDANAMHWPWYFAVKAKVADHYYQYNSHRQPLFVVLPGRDLFLIDGKCWKGAEYYGGWAVSGEAPDITMQPSINLGSTYHGYLTNGVISVDCEGRQYSPEGNLLPKG